MSEFHKLHPIMFAGTGSDVGKSIIATAFCRIFLEDGYHPAPFKAQNMALNSFATPEGLEIGRAQAVQAEAAGIPCQTDMNPLLLKPNSNHTSQVVLLGNPIGNVGAYDYFKEEGRDVLRTQIERAYDRLSARYNPIVLEGAGSISEINLRKTDLANISMAKYANADVFLVGDIDRGGIFASLYGSVQLLDKEERKLIKGILINKFRGDLRLFEKGVQMLEELCQVPVVGVVPYYNDIFIDEEDSMDLAVKSKRSVEKKINIAVILLSHISNFTDFNLLERDSRVNLFYTKEVKEIDKADIIILPGTKSTIADLYELRQNGMAHAILEARKRGASILGICGGYQMMGEEIFDPGHIEGDIEKLPGLGLLPVSTTISDKKITKQSIFSLYNMTEKMFGYEIHMGLTSVVDGATASPLLKFEDGHWDGYTIDQKCMGTYVHGILDNPSFISLVLGPHLKNQKNAEDVRMDYLSFKQEQYNKLANHVRSHVNMSLIYKILSGNA